MILIQPVSSLSIRRAVNLYTIILLLSFVVLLYWIAMDRYQTFIVSHENSASSTTRLISYQINKSLIEKQREVVIFVDTYKELLIKLSDSPDDYKISQQLTNRLKQYQPDLIDFNIISKSSRIIYGHLDSNNNSVYKDGLQHYIKTNQQPMQLHQYNDGHHYNIFSQLPTNNAEIYILFRFNTDEYSELLHSAQTMQHTLVLVDSEPGRSVGFNSQGKAKKIIGTMNFQVVNGSNLSTVVKTKIKDTNWYVVDMVDKNLYREFSFKILKEYFIAFYIFAMIVLFMRYILLKQDVKRSLAEEQLKKNHEQIKTLNNSLEQLSKCDSLTNLYNRRHFDEMIQHEWNRGARSKETLVCILMDIDHFKKYNDHYGHQSGDECIKDVARLLQETFRRAGDTVARYGGEEFIVAMSGSSEEEAKIALIKFQLALKKLKIPHVASDTDKFVTVSAGLSFQVPDQNTTIEKLIRNADEALYQAKQQGRNQFFVYEEEKTGHWKAI